MQEAGQQQCVQLEHVVHQLWQKEAQQAATKQRQQHQQLQQEIQNKYDKQLEELKERHRKEVERIIADQHVRQEQQKRDSEQVKKHRKSIDYSGFTLPDWPKPPLHETDTSHQERTEKMLQAAGFSSPIQPRDRSPEHSEWMPSFEFKYPSSNAADAVTSSSLPQRYDQNVDITFSNTRNRPNKDGFVSPLTSMAKTWNSKMLFGRPNPSPVATVHPQIKPVTRGETQSNDCQNELETRCIPASTLITNQNTKSNGGKSKKRGKKGKGRKGSKKSKKDNTQNIEEESNLIQQNIDFNQREKENVTQSSISNTRLPNNYPDWQRPSHIVKIPQNSGNKKDIFDFNDDDMSFTPFRKTTHQYTFQVRRAVFPDIYGKPMIFRFIHHTIVILHVRLFKVLLKLYIETNLCFTITF